MLGRFLGVGLICGAVTASAPATISFTFDDPGGGPEFLFTTGTDALTNPGHLSYVGRQVDLIVDASEEGLGVHQFKSELVLEIEIGAVESQVNNLLVSSVFGGSFEFRLAPQAATEGLGSDVILAGVITSGGVATFSTTGAVLSTSTFGGLELIEGPVLDAILGGADLVPVFDMSFTLTNIRTLNGGGGVTLTQDGFVQSFTANSAFTGNAELGAIPTPGPAALLVCGVGLSMTRRRR